MSKQGKGIPYLKVFGDWLVRFESLDDAQFGRLVRASIGFVCGGEEPTIDGYERLAFDFIRPALETDMAKYWKIVETNTANGAAGAAARWGKDGERHTENSERYLKDGDYSQEEETRAKNKEPKIQDSKREDSKGREDQKAALQKAWRDFNAMRNRIGQPVSAIDQKGITTRLQKYGGDDIEKQARMLNKATEKEWLTVYPLDEDGEPSEQLSAQDLVNKIAAGFSL